MEATRQFEAERSDHKLQKEKLETELAQLHTKLNVAKQVRKVFTWETKIVVLILAGSLVGQSAMTQK